MSRFGPNVLMFSRGAAFGAQIGARCNGPWPPKYALGAYGAGFAARDKDIAGRFADQIGHEPAQHMGRITAAEITFRMPSTPSTNTAWSTDSMAWSLVRK